MGRRVLVLVAATAVVGLIPATVFAKGEAMGFMAKNHLRAMIPAIGTCIWKRPIACCQMGNGPPWRIQAASLLCRIKLH